MKIIALLNMQRPKNMKNVTRCKLRCECGMFAKVVFTKSYRPNEVKWLLMISSCYRRSGEIFFK